MNKLHPVSEAEVIAGFLRNEFFHPEYDRDRTRFESLVADPDLKDAQQNALRMDDKFNVTAELAFLQQYLGYAYALRVADLDYLRFHNYIVITNRLAVNRSL